ncbi:nicotinamide phosphoribosyltransferase [Stenotrophomonas phage IME13]|uniref:Nicotinamide phosphoribosyltransferase n=1 Tax=Stenotrophomonas phage IME13 TaxID=1211280 RepID=J7HXW7_9CAUD|nr:nicotinamide phosphoribosyl transferase [Stenotrophomonas phage IME13]AFQ22587.1 nicotinamide phosphoribosyltransferase [Stenotrophomonas phage IME13]
MNMIRPHHGVKGIPLIAMTDSYKITHWNQMPEGTEEAVFYIEARGGKFDEIVIGGVEYLLTKFTEIITKDDIDEMDVMSKAHFGQDVFNREGWEAVRQYQEQHGCLPIQIDAVPEGTVVPVKNVVLTVRVKAPFVWLAGWFEPIILRAVWYTSTVATLSRECIKSIRLHLVETSDLEVGSPEFNFVLMTRLHDFGSRGVSSGESAAIGGCAHLYNSMGTDTVESLYFAKQLFGAEMAGISVPAREHSTVTSWGADREKDAYLNSVELFGAGAYSIVYDSTDFKKAIREIESYKDEVITKGGTLIARPDSGDMIDNISFALETLGEIFGYETNSKGYKVLNKHCRIIQGDGIDGPEVIGRVLTVMKARGWAAENIAFGMGGGLLQMVNRDTCKWAMKMSAIKINGVWKDVFKCPKGAEWKASKKGQLKLRIMDDGRYYTEGTIEGGQMLYGVSIKDGFVELMSKDAFVRYYDAEKGQKFKSNLAEIRQRTAIK